jgi:hypothetical protein
LCPHHIDLTGGPFQPYLSGIPDSVCAHQVSGKPDQVHLSGLPDSEWQFATGPNTDQL